LRRAQFLAEVTTLNWRDRIAQELKDVDEGGNQLHFNFPETDQPMQSTVVRARLKRRRRKQLSALLPRRDDEAVPPFERDHALRPE
jgi:hypothetical protein